MHTVSDDWAQEEGWEIIERFRYKSSLPLGRWLINRRRRREGKPPLR